MVDFFAMHVQCQRSPNEMKYTKNVVYLF